MAKYPPQEPLSAQGAQYAERCIELGRDVIGEEAAFGSDPYQTLAIFPSAQADGRVLLFWHGGGWTSGYKEWMVFMAPPLNLAGVTFVSAGYRLAPRHVFPAGVEDCALGLKWIYQNIAQYGGSRQKIYLGGHSAGAHYAALLVVDQKWISGVSLPENAIRGCLPISGVFDLTEGGGLPTRPRFLGPDGNELPASPIYNISRQPPPFFVSYGSRDFPHLIRQARAFCAALRNVDSQVVENEMADRDHFTASFAAGEPHGPWLHQALRFMA